MVNAVEQVVPGGVQVGVDVVPPVGVETQIYSPHVVVKDLAEEQEVLCPLAQLVLVDITPAHVVIGETHVVTGGVETQIVLSHCDVIKDTVGHDVV